MKKNQYRFIKKDLTIHEKEELKQNFNLDLRGYYILAALTQDEWKDILGRRLWKIQR